MRKVLPFLMCSFVTLTNLHAAEQQQHHNQQINPMPGSLASKLHISAGDAWNRVVDHISQFHSIKDIANPMLNMNLTEENWEGHMLMIGGAVAEFGQYLVSNPAFAPTLELFLNTPLDNAPAITNLSSQLVITYGFASMFDRNLKAKAKTAEIALKQYAQENHLQQFAQQVK